MVSENEVISSAVWDAEHFTLKALEASLKPFEEMMENRHHFSSVIP